MTGPEDTRRDDTCGACGHYRREHDNGAGPCECLDACDDIDRTCPCESFVGLSRYCTVVADPPWNVTRGRPIATNNSFAGAAGSARKLSYPTMTVDEIAALPIRDLANDDAHLYLWTINRYVEDAYRVARAWGFKPSTLLVWAKEPIGDGLGGAWGISTEFVLFARRGKLPHQRRIGTTWFNWPRSLANGHSTKPPAFLDLVEQVSPGPYLELFARRQRLGWDTWGNEALEHVVMSRGPGADTAEGAA